MQGGVSGKPKTRRWFSHRALWLLLVLALALAAGGAALAQAPDAGSQGAQDRDTPSGDAWRNGRPPWGECRGPCPPWRGWRFRGGPGGLRQLTEYLGLEPDDLFPLVKEHGWTRVLMGAPLAKLSGKPLAEVLEQRGEADSWSQVARKLGVDLGSYLDEVEKLLTPKPRPERPNGPQQGKPADEGAGEAEQT
ncbi:MAG: hypothetical protein K6T75_04230 [Acetobacteraceae bacterium]|nr:hypothetical protein [Acetobacteraceae bacterium]